MSSSLNEGAIITYAIDELTEVFEGVTTLQDVAQKYEPPAGSMQRSSNAYYKPVQQQAVEHEGWDMTSTVDGVLELSIGGALGDPRNTSRSLRADDLRDESSWRRAVRADAMKLASKMEQRGLEKAAHHGSFCVTNSNAFGSSNVLWDGLAEAEARMFETEMAKSEGTCAFLNAQAYRAGGYNLVQDSPARFSSGIPDDAYNKGMLQRQIAGISDVYRHDKLVKMGAQSASITVNGNQSFKPQATETAPSGAKVPFDNRYATIPTNEATTAINVGDKFKIANLKAVSLDVKNELDYDQTFTVVATDTNSLTISPRPIALDDGTLSDLEKAYANVSTTIKTGDTLVWLNTTARTSNVVMAKDSLVLASNPIPFNHELFSNFRSEAFQVGALNGMIGYQGDLKSADGYWRIALWYDWQVERPESIGIILDSQS